MALLSNITERFWNYVSPRKTLDRRDKPFKTPALPLSKPSRRKSDKSASSRASMSPRSRVKNWTLVGSDTGRPADNRAPFATPSLGRATPSHEIGMDLEGDTLVIEADGYEEDLEDITQYDANDETMVDHEYQLEDEIVIDLEEERRKWVVKSEEMRRDGWSEDAISIYVKIGMRGHQPLLPVQWSFDFPTLPASMFSGNNESYLIKSVSGREFQGVKATHDLLFLGMNIRDARQHYTWNRTSDFVAKQAVDVYFRWARKDGAVDTSMDIPTLAVVAGGIDIPAAELQDRMVLQLHELADRYRDALRVHQSTEPEDDIYSQNPPSEAEYSRKLPTLYGIIASHTVLAFVSYDIANADPGLRIIGVFDYGESHTDVWNSLALAQFCIHARDAMMHLKPYVCRGTCEMEFEESDPDA